MVVHLYSWRRGWDGGVWVRKRRRRRRGGIGL